VQPFNYICPHSIDDVVALLANNGGQVRILSGGTDLLVQLREGRRAAQLVVDIKQLPEVGELRYDPAMGQWLGAAAPCCRIAGDAALAARYPGLIDAVALIGGVQIQGRASVGGNLCNASPAADSIPALIVHRAACIIAGPGGRRELPVEEFCVSPGQTALGPGELLLGLRLPPPPHGFGAAYLRFTTRNEMDIAVVGAGAAVILDERGGVFEAARIALGAVAPTPIFVREAEAALAGQPVSDAAVDAAARAAQAAARPIDDVRGTAAQRTQLTAVLVRRALRRATERARAALEEE
jgi:carbon-monoxide dehydrogenase medium subunit